MKNAEVYRRVLVLLDEIDDLLQNLVADEYDYLMDRSLEVLPNKIQQRLRHAERGMQVDWENATKKE